MAGRTHWSAAVEVAADRNGITFDVAARVQSPPQRLGSEYSSPLAPVLRGEGPGVRGMCVALEPVSNCTRDVMRFVPNSPKDVPATTAWRYTLGVTT
jgi:hypothetical protein